MMKAAHKLLLVIALSAVPFCLAIKTKNDLEFRDALHVGQSAAPYPIAGPRPGREFIRPKAAAPQSRGLQTSIPGLSGPAGIQFSSIPFASLLALIYSASIPAFLWLSFSARVAIMKSWYSAFNLGLICFAIVLKLTIDLPLILCAILSVAAVALGYFGFQHPDYTFIGISVWGSFAFTNLFHVIFGATEGTNYYGLGEYSWIIYVAALLVYILYISLEAAFFEDSQNFMCAFTCAYASVAGISFLFKFLFLAPHSPFDVLTFLSLPMQFRWDDPISITLLVLLLLVTAFGFGFSKYRIYIEGPTPGFSSGDRSSLPTSVKEPLFRRAAVIRDSVSMPNITSSMPFLSSFGFSSSDSPSAAEDNLASEEMESHNETVQFDLMSNSDEPTPSNFAITMHSTVSTDCEGDSPASQSLIPREPSALGPMSAPKLELGERTTFLEFSTRCVESGP